jgi:hypothetical protein
MTGMAWFINYYRCPKCGQTWCDEWSAQCDDDCPNCGARHISPYKSADAPIDHEVIVAQLIAAVSEARDHGDDIPDWLSDLEDAAIELTKNEGGDVSDDERPDPIKALKLAREHIERQRQDYESGLEDGTYDDRDGYGQLCADLAKIDAAIVGGR